ncbi:MAG: hypothetical protein E4H23_10330 [Chrysiogenales bacterium]|nr:MAG: hypothetical protein E4H23_10330 [Chrysiogenales bacterium]
MKTKWVLILLVILAATPAAAASITVKSPVAGDNLEIGLTKSITWTYSGLPNATKIEIVLWRNGSKLGSIAQDLGLGSNGQGSYSWNAGTFAGGPALAGSGYSIKVRNSNNTVSAFSGSFSLIAKPTDPGNPPPLITLPIKMFPTTGQPCMAVTSPKAGALTNPFGTVYVMWTKNGSQDANVSVTLLRRVTGKARILGTEVPLAASTPNDTQFNWEPASLNPAPGIYAIKVRTLDGKCEAVSGDFTMQETGGIELLSPKGGEVWESGTSHAVTWKRSGNIQTVDILLARTGSWNKALVQGIDAKLGTMSCVFAKDANDAAGSQCYYRVFLKQSAGGSTNFSGCFTLAGNPDLAVSASFSPTMANVGTNLTFAIKIENKGMFRSQACQGDFYVNGVVAQSFPVPAIDPGATATVSRIWKLACPGTVKIIIDPGQANVDPDKANNSWEKVLCSN